MERGRRRSPRLLARDELTENVNRRSPRISSRDELVERRRPRDELVENVHRWRPRINRDELETLHASTPVTTASFGQGGTTASFGQGGTTATTASFGQGGTTASFGQGGSTASFGQGGTTASFGQGRSTASFGQGGWTPGTFDTFGGGSAPPIGGQSGVFGGENAGSIFAVFGENTVLMSTDMQIKLKYGINENTTPDGLRNFLNRIVNLNILNDTSVKKYVKYKYNPLTAVQKVKSEYQYQVLEMLIDAGFSPYIGQNGSKPLMELNDHILVKYARLLEIKARVKEVVRYQKSTMRQGGKLESGYHTLCRAYGNESLEELRNIAYGIPGVDKESIHIMSKRGLCSIIAKYHQRVDPVRTKEEEAEDDIDPGDITSCRNPRNLVQDKYFGNLDPSEYAIDSDNYCYTQNELSEIRGNPYSRRLFSTQEDDGNLTLSYMGQDNLTLGQTQSNMSDHMPRDPRVFDQVYKTRDKVTINDVYAMIEQYELPYFSAYAFKDYSLERLGEIRERMMVYFDEAIRDQFDIKLFVPEITTRNRFMVDLLGILSAINIIDLENFYILSVDLAGYIGQAIDV